MKISNVSVHLGLAIKTQVLRRDFIMLFGKFIFYVMFTHFVVRQYLEKLHEKRLIWLELFRDTQCAVRYLHVRKLDRYLENNDSFTFMEKICFEETKKTFYNMGDRPWIYYT